VDIHVMAKSAKVTKFTGTPSDLVGRYGSRNLVAWVRLQPLTVKQFPGRECERLNE